MLTNTLISAKIVKYGLLIAIMSQVIFVLLAHQLSFSQNSSNLLPSTIPTETIKIVKPTTTQNVSAGQELLISGTSSDTSVKNCSVSVIVNNLRPYQTAIAKGSDGMSDYSQWEFALRDNYTHINEGENKITAKLLCSSASPRWYSVFINGVPNNSNIEQLSPVKSEEEQKALSANLSSDNNIETSNEELPTVQSDEEQNLPSSDLSVTNNANNNEELSTVQSDEEQNLPSSDLSVTNNTESDDNALVISIVPLNDPVSRGDTQSVTITVTDSTSNAIANADIDGNLIYPGDNFEKQFNGITDSQGEFVYSWTIGENGDVGPLSVQVDVSDKEHLPSSASSSFDIVDLSED
ncbi:MAG TPA: hypothetical protein VE594_01425 [Nitrososphaeraceae archaeon]|nr:hypothetical protein [Nitrososphaeraceae archaeon]